MRPVIIIQLVNNAMRLAITLPYRDPGMVSVRTTVTQNLLLRWVSKGDLPSLYVDLKRLGLAEPGAGRLADVKACPGTDSCKLGITSSRGLAAELKVKFANGMGTIADREDINFKVRGCFNACCHHHIADIGFLGSVQRKKSDTAPVFQVVLGGSTGNNGSSFGLVSKIGSSRLSAAE